MSLIEETTAPVGPPSSDSLGNVSPTARRVLLVWDAPNLDMGLGSILGRRPTALERPRVHPAQGARRARVALLAGCAQQVLAPEINAATIRLLNRLGVEVVVHPDSGCCGALNHHMGQHVPALQRVRDNVAAWSAEIEGDGLDAIVINASGCNAQTTKGCKAPVRKVKDPSVPDGIALDVEQCFDPASGRAIAHAV